MRAFEFHVNGNKVCSAGLGDDGVLTAILSSVTIKGTESHLELYVGGLVSTTGEHLTWVKQNLHLDDELRVKVVEISSPDHPVSRERTDQTKDLK